MVNGETTVFGGVIDFIARLGFYDVILPFLLTFTLVYAILDKTKVFGTEEGKGKKNLNSIVAFVMGLLVVFVKPLVRAINEALANIVVLMLIGVFFMVLVGIFLKEGAFSLQEGKETKYWYIFFIFFMFIGIVFIFLHAFRVADGRTWLQVIGDFIKASWTSAAAASVLFVIGIVLFMIFVTWPFKKAGQGGTAGG
jgi:hypothetical membrane protein